MLNSVNYVNVNSVNYVNVNMLILLTMLMHRQSKEWTGNAS